VQRVLVFLGIKSTRKALRDGTVVTQATRLDFLRRKTSDWRRKRRY
jgi:hypothetical protein